MKRCSKHKTTHDGQCSKCAKEKSIKKAYQVYDTELREQSNDTKDILNARDEQFWENQADKMAAFKQGAASEDVIEKFKKNDQGKLRWDLMPVEAMEEVIKVFGFGATKYGDFNWQKNDAELMRLSASVDRHHNDWKKGRKLDHESGLYELAHMVTTGLMLLHHEVMGTGIDNRPGRKK